MRSVSRHELEATPEILDYVEWVEEQARHPDTTPYPVCGEQTLLCGFIRRVFDSEEIYVDREQLAQYLSYQKYFDYELFLWERFCFALHNCTYRKDGRLRFPELFIYVGRGAGKNGYLSFEDFCLLTPANGVRNYDIDIFANSEDQAMTSFKDILAVLKNPKHTRKLSRFFGWNAERIWNKQTDSVLRFRTSNAKTKDGGRPGKVDHDEYHAFEDYRMINVSVTGLGKVRLPRRTIITTDGDVRDGPLDALKERAVQILKGNLPDNGLLCFMCRLDSKAEVQDERMWHKANPSLRFFPELLDQLRREYADYQQDQLGNAAFMTKRMNQPVSGSAAIVASWENILACSRAPASMPDVWVAGIDFAKTTDFVAAAVMGVNREGEWVWQSHTWVCANSVDLPRIRFPVAEAAEKGLLTIVNDVEIAPDLPVDWIAEQRREKRILGVGIDNYRFTLIEKALTLRGFEAGKGGNVLLVKGAEMAKTAPAVVAQFARQGIAFGDNPLMRWYINNACQVQDKRGNLNFGKIEPRSRKTDGFMACVACAAQLDLLEQDQAQRNFTFDLFSFD